MASYLSESIGKHGTPFGLLAVMLSVPAMAGGGWLMWLVIAAWSLLMVSILGVAYGIMADDIAEDVRVARHTASIDESRRSRLQAAAEAGPQETTGTAG